MFICGEPQISATKLMFFLCITIDSILKKIKSHKTGKNQ